MQKNKSDNAPKSTLEITFPSLSDKQRKNTSRVIQASLLALFIYILLEMTILSMFQIESIHFVSLIPGMIILLLLYYINKRRTLIVSIAVLSSMMAFIFFRNNMMAGLLTILNEAYATIGRNTGINLPIYKIGESSLSPAINASMCWVFLSFLIAIVLFYVSKSNRIGLYLLFMIGLYLFQYIFNVQPNVFINVGLFLVILLQMVKSYTIGKNRTVLFGGKASKVIYSILGLVVIILLIAVALTLYLSPAATYEKSTFANQMKMNVTSAIENIRYEKDNTSVLTQGDFTKLSELDFPEKQALEVVMEEPVPLYLRGYVGSTYTGKRWDDLDSDVYYENHGLFYWLNDANFIPLNQLSGLENATKSDVGDHAAVTIQNIHANSKYLYIPYELRSNLNELDKTHIFDQSHIKSTELFGHRLYHYDIQTELVEKYPTLANAVYSNDVNHKTEEYLSSESHYNEYVYEHYTDVPAYLTEMLDSSLEELSNEGEEHLPYEIAMDTIQTYLYETINYKINPDQLPKEQDFMTFLLEESQEGYSTHFATAGTLMFRHVGIPARYVEGYLVTPKDIEDKDSYEKIAINEENAHAWTEIYVDKVGWIPIELTPPYFEVMPEIDLSDYPTGDERENKQEKSQDGSDGGQDEDTEEISNVEQPEESNEQKEKETDWNTYAFVIFLTLMIMLFLATLIYVIKKRLARRLLLKSLHDAHTNIAITRMFSYSLSLLHYDGLLERGGSTYSYETDIQATYGSAYADSFMQAVKLNQLAQYSKHEMTEEERQMMLQFMEDTKMHVVMSKSFIKRIKMRYWDFIY